MTCQFFRPVQPMLAQTAEDTDEAIADLGQAALEYKLDGARVQVHRSGDDVRVYSRQLNDVTAAVPEIVEAVRAMPGEDLILDGEVLSLNPTGGPSPFRSPCGGSDANWMWIACVPNSPCIHSGSI